MPPLDRGLLSADTYQRLASAQHLVGSGDYAGALARLNSLVPRVRTNPYEYAVTEQNLAYLYITRGDYAGALPHMLQAMQQNALPPAAQRALVLDLAKLYARNGQYPQAEQVLAAWSRVAANPPPDAQVLAAVIAAHKGQCRAALPRLQRAVQASVNPPESWYRLWLACLYQTRDYAGAVNVLYALLGRWPQRAEYWRQLGESYAQLGDRSRALAVYALMRRLGLLAGEQDYLTLVALYMQNGAPYPAAQTLQAALQGGQVAASEQNYLLLAQVWLAARDREAALSALGAAARLARSGEPYLQQALLYQQVHEWFSVIDATRKALAKGGLRHPGRAWLLQGVAAAENKQYAEAETALKQAARYNGSRVQAEVWLRYLQARSSQNS